jgi:bifunctional DNA-binding transcriptional regulator/antitoxin component of YhaV-PrlF toxin-antitoxin module
MKRISQTVRISSKGQIVITFRVRRAMGLATGGELRVRLESPRRLVLSLPDVDEASLQAIFDRAQKWTQRTGRDLVEELHERRRSERVRERRG